MTDDMESLKGLVPKIYDDALRPSVKAVGETMEGAVRLTLRPVNGLVWSLDKCADWVVDAVSKKFTEEEINRDSLKTPPPETTMRVLVGLQTSGALEDPLPRMMFANILSGSMIETDHEEAHPAFAEILKNMVSIECRMLSIIACQPSVVIGSSAFTHHRVGKDNLYFSTDESPLQDLLGIETQRKFGLYLNNLERLGLIKTEYHRDLKPDEAPTKEIASILHKHWEEFKKFKADNDAEDCPSEIKNTTTSTVRLTSWGDDFAVATGANRAYSPGLNVFNIPNWAQMHEKP